jgi:hypothetical protein
MKLKSSSRRKRNNSKSILRLPDLEHAKAAVLNSLNSADAKRGYRHAIDEFVDWYCSEPRLAFNRIVVLRYRSHLESRQLAPGTINLRLGAVRRLAYEAADCVHHWRPRMCSRTPAHSCARRLATVSPATLRMRSGPSSTPFRQSWHRSYHASLLFPSPVQIQTAIQIP